MFAVIKRLFWNLIINHLFFYFFKKVIFSGPANVTATVFDHENGSYEAIALLVDPGIYTITAVIERTLCEPQIEPEPSVYAIGKYRHYFQCCG